MDWTFAVLLGVLAVSTALALENKELEISSSEEEHDNMCEGDDMATKMCYQCTAFDNQLGVTFESCCSEKRTYMFCDACMGDKDSCKKLMQEIEEAYAFSEDFYGNEDDSNPVIDDTYTNADNDFNMFDMQYSKPDLTVNKRFGRLFVQSPKRYGSIFFGKRSGLGQATPIDKRYGRLFVGSGGYFGKRAYDEDKGEEQDFSVDKRYGRLFANKYWGQNGNKNHWFGKRSFAEIPFDESVPEKRYRRIYLGRNGSIFGKRSSPYMESVDESSSESDDAYNGNGLAMDKRYGRLYVNRMNLFRPRPYDKRYGRLFAGPRRNYFG